jgi:hypothetical protein
MIDAQAERIIIDGARGRRLMLMLMMMVGFIAGFIDKVFV